MSFWIQTNIQISFSQRIIILIGSHLISLMSTKIRTICKTSKVINNNNINNKVILKVPSKDTTILLRTKCILINTNKDNLNNKILTNNTITITNSTAPITITEWKCRILTLPTNLSRIGINKWCTIKTSNMEDNNSPFNHKHISSNHNHHKNNKGQISLQHQSQ